MFLQNVKREQFLQHAPKNVGSVHLKAHTHRRTHNKRMHRHKRKETKCIPLIQHAKSNPKHYNITNTCGNCLAHSASCAFTLSALPCHNLFSFSTTCSSFKVFEAKNRRHYNRKTSSTTSRNNSLFNICIHVAI